MLTKRGSGSLDCANIPARGQVVSRSEAVHQMSRKPSSYLQGDLTELARGVTSCPLPLGASRARKGGSGTGGAGVLISGSHHNL